MLKALSYVRLAWLRGLFGTGKTLLSVALFFELWKSGWRGSIFSPFPVLSPSSLTSRAGFLVLDEAGTVFSSRSFADKSLSADALRAVSFLRKTDSYLIFPSYTRPDILFRRGLHVERVFALPSLWVYRYWLPQSEDEEDNFSMAKLKGYYPLLFPSRYFRFYDTRFVPEPFAVRNAISSFNKFTLGN